jgi:hypothetical protein
MAQTSPQLKIETVEPPHLLLVSTPLFVLRAGAMMLYSRLIEAKEMSALAH